MSEWLSIIFVAWVALAWITHVVTTIKSASWALLFIGAIFFPVGCVHGTGIWLGIF